ncbi:MAG: GNAT family N-acetyltransferase, partial [Anaerolineales bacterium]
MSTNPIILPDRPAIEGLCFHSICGEKDADALYAVHAGRIAHDGVDHFSRFEDLPSRDGLRAAVAQAVAAQQQNQWLVAQINEQVVGYSQLESWYEEDGRWVYLILGWVLPERRGRGIGTAMLHWGEETARQLAAAQHPNETFEFAANASSTEQDTTALLLHEGYYVGFTSLT